VLFNNGPDIVTFQLAMGDERFYYVIGIYIPPDCNKGVDNLRRAWDACPQGAVVVAVAVVTAATAKTVIAAERAKTGAMAAANAMVMAAAMAVAVAMSTAAAKAALKWLSSSSEAAAAVRKCRSMVVMMMVSLPWQ
jgi:hypothetical protein